jgi:ABC-type Fe3+ transport system permease subunit
MDDTDAIDSALVALFWIGVFAAFGTVLLAWMLSWVAARPRGLASFVLTLVAVVSIEVTGLVLWLGYQGDATRSDFIWLFGAVLVGALCIRQLVHRRRAALGRSA